jgi:hypothetical protein
LTTHYTHQGTHRVLRRRSTSAPGHHRRRRADNIITDDPDLLIRVRREWASRTESERLLLASRLLLGLDPWDAGTETPAINP